MQKFMQLKNYLLELSFLALIIRSLFVGAGIGEALAIGFVVISMGYKEYLNKSKVDQYEELKSLVEDSHSQANKKFDEIFSRFNAENLNRELRNKPQVVQNEEKPKRRLF